jgi:membrane protein DedA with SNARE-associated domain
VRQGAAADYCEGLPASRARRHEVNISDLIETYGYLAVFGLVGAESLGIPLPGETALITASI